LISSIDGTTYKWFKDGKEITGQNGKILNIFEIGDGNYQVEVINEGGCGTISETLEFKVNSVGYFVAENFGIEITPNPNNGIFVISIPNSINGQTIDLQIIDIQGKIHYSKEYSNLNKININLNNIPNGTYFINLTINNKVYALKFQKI